MKLDCGACNGTALVWDAVEQDEARCPECYGGKRPCELCGSRAARVEHPLWDDEVSCLACEAISQAEMGWAL